MNINSYFEHWGIAENPFRAEEARQDGVFDRLGVGPTSHPDFEKIVGDFSQVSTSIVFGEKGSGKTAIRIQLARRVDEHNALHPDQKVFLVPYDDLNPILDRFYASTAGAPASPPADKPGGDRKKQREYEETVLNQLKKFRLVDHMDGILHTATRRLIDGVLHERAEPDGDLGEDIVKRLRRADSQAKRDLLVLQAVYDRSTEAPERTRRLKRRMRGPFDRGALLWVALAWSGWILPAAVLGLWFTMREDWGDLPWMEIFFAALAIWGLVLVKRLVWDRLVVRRLAGKICRQMRVTPRSTTSLSASLGLVPARDRDGANMPTDASDDHRYAMFDRLRRALFGLGFKSTLVILDRIDEPTLVNGDPERMQAIIWPMLNNKFLQMENVGFKLLLPIELRHSLFRETASFFQEARLDKQNLIERLNWTGATLYDLCSARLQVCRPGATDNISLVDLFEDDVTRQDIVDALDQMHQPRDAFKFLYQCIQEHCSNVTQEQANWRVPRLVLESVRRQQADRVQQLFRGVRPA